MSADILAPLVNFAVVVFILVYFGRKPFVEFFASRSVSVSAAMTEAESYSRESMAEFSKWKKSASEKDMHVKQMEEDAKASIARLKERTLEHASLEAARIKKDAEMMAKSESLKASEQLQREVVAGSLEVAEKYLSQSLPPKDKAKLVEQYVELVSNGSR